MTSNDDPNSFYFDSKVTMLISQGKIFEHRNHDSRPLQEDRYKTFNNKNLSEFRFDLSRPNRTNCYKKYNRA